MGAFVFDKCCGCIELKTGCFIIAYLSLVGYSILAIMCIMGLAVGGAVMSGDDSLDQAQKDAAQQTGLIVLIAAGFLLLCVIFALTFVIVLLVGLHKNRPGHVKAYLVCALIFLVLSILQFIGSVSTGQLKGGKIASDIFNILLTMYFILVIRSQYLVMKNEPKRGPAIYSAA